MHTDLQLTALLVFMIFGAIIAVEGRDLLSSVISAGLVGFGASIGFLMLGAPELAVTQVVVEITCLVILIRATVVRDETVVHRYKDTFAVAAGLLAVGVVLVAAMAVYVQKGPGRGLPPFGQPVALQPLGEAGKAAPRGGPSGLSRRYLDEGAAGPADRPAPVHLANRVSAVLLDYRAFDTLGQMAVLTTAIVGAMVILRKRGKSDGRDEPAG
jgi:multicomponent Na+:H+ antiporter subunit B